MFARDKSNCGMQHYQNRLTWWLKKLTYSLIYQANLKDRTAFITGVAKNVTEEAIVHSSLVGKR